jgi:cation:H+ antiporter
MATIRKERDIAIGNVVGSNLFNILGVLGLASLVGPRGVGVAPAALAVDIPVMVLVALVTLPIAFSSSVIARWEGGLLFGGYAMYTTYLVLRSTDHPTLGGFSTIALFVAVPAMLFVVVAGAARWWLRPSEPAPSAGPSQAERGAT